MIKAGEIDGGFAPRPRDDVASVELDGEVVLAATEEGGFLVTHWLNATGAIVWQCFDGSVSLDELIDDLCAAFDADRDVVADDVLRLTQLLGAAGLLDGVERELRYRPSGDAYVPEGLPEGTPVPAFSLPDLDGRSVELADLLGGNDRTRRLLLVNWSPGCAFCVKIAESLAVRQAELRAHDTELVLLAHGTADANRQLLMDSGLDCIVLLQTEAPVEVFAGLGTPCAYLVDQQGTIASALAMGANQVPALATIAAGRAAGD
jgi:peroxiredoxin